MSPSLVSLKNRHIVVTGGRGSLGTGIIQVLRDMGAICWVPDMRSNADEASEEGVHFLPGVDLSNEQAVAKVYAEVAAQGELWGSIHSVGGFSMSPITETSASEVSRLFGLNALTAFLCSREAVRHMRAQKSGGRIVNVAARPALTPTGGMLAYSMSKAAVAALTTGLAEEVKKDGILVNAVAPATIDTPDNRAAMPGADTSRWVSTEDIARAIAFLVSPDNSLTTGLVMPVYGQG